PDEAEAAFYEALELGDVERLMQTWSDDEEIVCIHPGGDRLIGVHAVRTSWQEILANGVLPVRPLRVHAVQSMMSSVHAVIEQLMVETHEGARTINCYATNVFHKGPSGWRLVLHHSSQAPDDSSLPAIHEAPDVLH